MNKYSIFNAVQENDFHDTETCLSAERRNFLKNDIIIRSTDTNNNIGIINKGLAFLLSISEDGETSIIDYYEKGNIFGKIFTPESNVNLYYIVAKENCEITFFDYEKLISCCTQNCEKHGIIISSIVADSFRRCQMHIDILSCRSIRGKLSAYFKYMKEQKHSDRFDLPISLSDLADYISVDRSAMMRELRKMKNEGLITAQGSKITVISL